MRVGRGVTAGRTADGDADEAAPPGTIVTLTLLPTSRAQASVVAINKKIVNKGLNRTT
jgi:hypothetical protein